MSSRLRELRVQRSQARRWGMAAGYWATGVSLHSASDLRKLKFRAQKDLRVAWRAGVWPYVHMLGHLMAMDNDRGSVEDDWTLDFNVWKLDIVRQGLDAVVRHVQWDPTDPFLIRIVESVRRMLESGATLHNWLWRTNRPNVAA